MHTLLLGPYHPRSTASCPLQCPQGQHCKSVVGDMYPHMLPNSMAYSYILTYVHNTHKHMEREREFSLEKQGQPNSGPEECCVMQDLRVLGSAGEAWVGC